MLYLYFRQQIIDVLTATGTSEKELEILKVELKKRQAAEEEFFKSTKGRRQSEGSNRSSRQRRTLFLESRNLSGMFI